MTNTILTAPWTQNMPLQGRHGRRIDTMRIDVKIAMAMFMVWCVTIILAFPHPSRAEIEGRSCLGEPTDDVISFGDLITCTIDSVGDTDKFSFAGHTGESVVVRATPQSGGDPCVELFGPNGTLIDWGCGGYPFGEPRVDATLEQDGTYTILVSEYQNNATMSYALSYQCIGSCPAPPTGVEKAYEHLNTVMDQFHRTFDVFTDLGAAGNHFATRCAIADNDDVSGVAFDETWTQNCRAGATCIKNTFAPPTAHYWGGWYFQNGVLLAGGTQPDCNWGDHPNAGFDLTGATKITFWARGEHGGEQIEFFAGGIGRNPATGEPVQPYPDSFPRRPSVGQVTTLTTEWQVYTIDLTGHDLSYVVGGFGWVANAPNNPDGATFYLDDIQYDKANPDALRFLVSYETLPAPPAPDFDTILKNVAFTYDNVVVLLAYLARGTADDLHRAKLLADAFVYAQDHDRYYEDGRLRNAYQGGDLILPPGWRPNDKEGTARLPGWWDAVQQQWFEDADQVGTSTGNIAWVMIGLLRAYQVLGDTSYLASAMRLGNWVETNTRDTQGDGGYTGGFKGWEPTPEKLTWKSTEHNLDLYVVFITLFDLTGDPVWQERALHARQFVRAMWGACGVDHFATGTHPDGVTPNCDFAPADVNTWGLMALGEVTSYGTGIDWVWTNCKVSEPCVQGWTATGIDFNHDADGIWWEGTAHTVIALQIKGQHTEADELLTNLRQAQHAAPHTNGKGLVATCHDGVTTGIAGFLLFNRLHVAATAWYAMAEQEHNPFWGIRTSESIPHEGE